MILYGWDPTVKTGQNTIMEEMLMFSYVWPIALVVLSNVAYQICAKSVPEEMNPFASLTVTYLVGAAASGILFFALDHSGNLIHEVQKINWAPLVLGIVIVGLEAGWIYAYKAGWQVSTMSPEPATLASASRTLPLLTFTSPEPAKVASSSSAISSVQSKSPEPATSNSILR